MHVYMHSIGLHACAAHSHPAPLQYFQPTHAPRVHHACAPTSVHACMHSQACVRTPSPIHACAPPALAQFARSRGKGRGDSVIRGHRARDSVRGPGADSTCDSVIRGHAILCVAAAA